MTLIQGQMRCRPEPVLKTFSEQILEAEEQTQGNTRNSLMQKDFLLEQLCVHACARSRTCTHVHTGTGAEEVRGVRF